MRCFSASGGCPSVAPVNGTELFALGQKPGRARHSTEAWLRVLAPGRLPGQRQSQCLLLPWQSSRSPPRRQAQTWMGFPGSRRCRLRMVIPINSLYGCLALRSNNCFLKQRLLSGLLAWHWPPYIVSVHLAPVLTASRLRTPGFVLRSLPCAKSPPSYSLGTPNPPPRSLPPAEPSPSPIFNQHGGSHHLSSRHYQRTKLSLPPSASIPPLPSLPHAPD